MTDTAGRERLPVPDWDRPNETWRVEAEPGGWHLTDDGVCSGKGCFRRAVVWRDIKPFGLCAVHVREFGMWIENGLLVSWALRP